MARAAAAAAAVAAGEEAGSAGTRMCSSCGRVDALLRRPGEPKLCMAASLGRWGVMSVTVRRILSLPLGSTAAAPSSALSRWSSSDQGSGCRALEEEEEAAAAATESLGRRHPARRVINSTSPSSLDSSDRLRLLLTVVATVTRLLLEKVAVRRDVAALALTVALTPMSCSMSSDSEGLSPVRRRLNSSDVSRRASRACEALLLGLWLLALLP